MDVDKRFLDGRVTAVVDIKQSLSIHWAVTCGKKDRRPLLAPLVSKPSSAAGRPGPSIDQGEIRPAIFWLAWDGLKPKSDPFALGPTGVIKNFLQSGGSGCDGVPISSRCFEGVGVVSTGWNNAALLGNMFRYRLRCLN